MKKLQIKASIGWKYRLSSSLSKKLRNDIQEENSEEVIEDLKSAYEELYHTINDEEVFSEWDKDDYIEDLEGMDFDDDPEEVEDSVDYELFQFYDWCDSLRIWIEV